IYFLIKKNLKSQKKREMKADCISLFLMKLMPFVSNVVHVKMVQVLVIQLLINCLRKYIQLLYLKKINNFHFDYILYIYNLFYFIYYFILFYLLFYSWMVWKN